MLHIGILGWSRNLPFTKDGSVSEAKLRHHELDARKQTLASDGRGPIVLKNYFDTIFSGISGVMKPSTEMRSSIVGRSMKSVFFWQ